MPHSEIMTNTATGIVAGTTIASGIATWFDVLEHGVGLLASLAGLILASLMIWKAWLSIQSKRLELKALEEERRRND